MNRRLVHYETRGGKWAVSLWRYSKPNASPHHSVIKYKHGEVQAGHIGLKDQAAALAELKRVVADAAEVDLIHYNLKEDDFELTTE